MIKVKKERVKSQWYVGRIQIKSAAPIQVLIKLPVVIAARKFVEENLVMTFSMEDSQADLLEDQYVASYPVPRTDHEQVYDNPSWMLMKNNRTMWVLIEAVLCVEKFTTCILVGSTTSFWYALTTFGDVTSSYEFSKRRRVATKSSSKLYEKHSVRFI